MLDTGWDWDRIPFDFPPEIKLMFQAILINLIGRGSDRLAWVNNPRGDFDLKRLIVLPWGLIQIWPSLLIGFGNL